MTQAPKNGIEKRSLNKPEFHFIKSSSGIHRIISDPGISQYRASALADYLSGKPLNATGQITEGFDLSQLDLERLKLAISPTSKLIPQKRVQNNIAKGKEFFAGSWESGPEESAEKLKNSQTAKGVIFTDLLSAEKQYPELLSKVLGKIIRAEENKFTALPAALGQFGLFIYVPAGVKIKEPFYYQNLSANPGEVGLTQLLVYLESAAEITLIQNQVGGALSGESLQVGTTEIILERGAKMSFFEIASMTDQTWSISQEKASVGDEAELFWAVAAFGNRFNKQVFNVDLTGKNSRCSFSGFSLTGKSQQYESMTYTRHLAPYSESKLILKNVLFEDGKSKWRGLIKVEPDAMHSDGYQVNRNLILSKEASVESIPGLEILTDEVRCSHGSTTGRIDPEELFYLQSRGISTVDSQKLLVEGFIEPILKLYPQQPFQKLLTEKVQETVIKKIL